MANKGIRTYPEYLKVLWRFLRVFLATFFTLVGTGVATTDDGKQLKSLLVSACAGALVAFFKAVRVWFEKNNYKIWDKVVRKIPV